MGYNSLVTSSASNPFLADSTNRFASNTKLTSKSILDKNVLRLPVVPTLRVTTRTILVVSN